jgi:oxalate decarboxylase/phosphoglucose isomerase-like protein (cupin superfamily)
MDVKWLITRETVGAQRSVVGRSVLPPGAGHALHRHPNAEEWEYILEGTGIKRVGDDEISFDAGDLVFVPRNIEHSLMNPSTDGILVTIWGYCGAGSLDEAGYILGSDDAHE